MFFLLSYSKSLDFMRVHVFFAKLSILTTFPCPLGWAVTRRVSHAYTSTTGRKYTKCRDFSFVAFNNTSARILEPRILFVANYMLSSAHLFIFFFLLSRQAHGIRIVDIDFRVLLKLSVFSNKRTFTSSWSDLHSWQNFSFSFIPIFSPGIEALLLLISPFVMITSINTL